MKINFYTYCNYGDVHVSRTYIKYILETFPSHEYTYYHNNPIKLTADIPIQIKTLKSNDIFKINYKNNFIFKNNGEIFINTWYSAGNNMFYRPDAISIITLHKIFTNVIKEVFNSEINKPIIYFLPQIDYNFFNYEEIKNYVKKDTRKKILISNNNVQSQQSENFDFNPIIKILADKYKDIDFYISNKVNKNLLNSNIFYIEDLFKIDGCNLNEISYFSTFCDVIIGRYSGPMTFAMVKENVLNNNKTFINFVKLNGCYDPSFGIKKIRSEQTSAKFIASDIFKNKSIISVIDNTLSKGDN